MSERSCLILPSILLFHVGSLGLVNAWGSKTFSPSASLITWAAARRSVLVSVMLGVSSVWTTAFSSSVSCESFFPIYIHGGGSLAGYFLAYYEGLLSWLCTRVVGS